MKERPPSERTPTRRFEFDESRSGDLLERLRRLSRLPIASLTPTDNRARIASARPTNDGLALRVHRSFTRPEALDGAAGESLVAALLVAVVDPRGAPRRELRRARCLLRESFARGAAFDVTAVANGSGSPSASAPSHAPRPLRTRGAAHDLGALLERLRREDFFSGHREALEGVAISWGQRPRRASRRGHAGSRRAGRTSLRLGSYTAGTRLVRIHPVLDHREVPAFVVASIVRHELLHAVVPPDRRPGSTRRRVHPPAFRRIERTLPDFERAEAWIEARIDWLVAQRERLAARR